MAFTSISIVAPSSAPAGSSVGVTVRVRNTDTLLSHIIATSVAAARQSIIDETDLLSPGESKYYYGSFTMPNEDTIIYAATWYWDYDHWALDNTRDKTVALEEVAPEYSITTRVSPSGTGYVTKEPDKTKYASGELVRLTAYPYSGYEFDYWDIDGEWFGTANPINFLVVARDYIITAHFKEIPPPPVAGTITKKELDYQDIWQALPIYDIPVDTRIRVRITGRNDTDETQRMGISWRVWDPDGYVVHEYSIWEAWPYTGPSDEHRFVGGGFDLSKVGTYILEVGLFMNPESPEMVDSYYGALCTVAMLVPEPEFRGFALSEYTK